MSRPGLLLSIAYLTHFNVWLDRLPSLITQFDTLIITAFEGGPLVIRNPSLMNGPLAGNIIYRASRLLSIEVLHYSVLSLATSGDKWEKKKTIRSWRASFEHFFHFCLRSRWKNEISGENGGDHAERWTYNGSIESSAWSSGIANAGVLTRFGSA